MTCWHVNKRAGRTIRWLLGGGVVWALAGCAVSQGPLFAPVEARRVWPPPPAEPRIQFLGAIRDSRDLRAARPAKEAFLSALRGPRPPIPFSGPQTVAVHGSDLVAVADAAGGCVHIIRLDNRNHAVIYGFGDELFGTPVGVAWGRDRLFVTDAQRGEVIELDATGAFVRRFGRDVLEHPVGIAYGSLHDRLYVVDGGAGCVRVFDLTGRLVDTVGGPGVEPGSFHFPTYVCVSGDRLIVSDSGNFRVQVLDLDGHSIHTIGKKGNGAGDFSLPKGVATDRAGHIYVVDAHFENVQVFDVSGRLLMAFGQEGQAPGEFSLPAGVAIDALDRIWVADSANRRLQVFQYLGAMS